jgi:lipopolysaccharide/colanic/teichoic acid biosynthesis glycosyltransferase
MSEHALLPTSKTGRRWRVSPFDIICGVIAPLGAFALRDINMLNDEASVVDVYVYALVSCAITVIVTMAFRLGDILPRYFSFGDAVQVIKASATSVLLSGAVAFFVTRLDNLPRPTIISQFLILTALLLAGRGLGRHIRRRWRPERQLQNTPTSNVALADGVQNAIVIGVFPTTSTFLRLVEEAPESNIKVVLLLDPRPKYIGRTIAGYVIGGSPQQLDALLDEYGVHGVTIHRVFIAAPRGRLRASDTDTVLTVCAARNVHCEFISDMLSGMDPALSQPRPMPQVAALAANRSRATDVVVAAGGAHVHRSAAARSSPYLAVRRAVEILIVLALLIVSIPLTLALTIMILVGIGRPVLFWQQRVGRYGRAFPVYKFRTLKAPFDRHGRRLTEQERLNWVGRFVRATRLDEIPQLYNILRGDMALIGPRPLLPIDLPKGDASRLVIRPGLTGWAQVNGGKLLSVEDKNNLDKFYIANAGPLLDASIVWKTLVMMLRGDKVSELAIQSARGIMQAQH